MCISNVATLPFTGNQQAPYKLTLFTKYNTHKCTILLKLQKRQWKGAGPGKLELKT